MFGSGVQNCREVAVVFEQSDAIPGDPINRPFSAKSSLADGQEPSLEQPPDAPDEAIAGRLGTRKSHQLKKLVLAGKS
jgi:hypothetical protein